MTLCACLGSMNGEPYCPCAMRSRGLKTKADEPLTSEEKDKINKALGRVFGITHYTVERNKDEHIQGR